MAEHLSQSYCVFCKIIAGEAPGNIRYEDDEVAAFDNQLHWAPVMLLVMPSKHILQEDLWRSRTIAQVGAVALRLGEELCPGGFRLLSNIGSDALQTQEHAHLHVIGGAPLGLYV